MPAQPLSQNWFCVSEPKWEREYLLTFDFLFTIYTTAVQSFNVVCHSYLVSFQADFLWIFQAKQKGLFNLRTFILLVFFRKGLQTFLST